MKANAVLGIIKNKRTFFSFYSKILYILCAESTLTQTLNKLEKLLDTFGLRQPTLHSPVSTFQKAEITKVSHSWQFNLNIPEVKLDQSVSLRPTWPHSIPNHIYRPRLRGKQQKPTRTFFLPNLVFYHLI